MATFRFDGKKIPFRDGDTLASALHREGVLEISRSLKYHRPRGLYCNVGSCASCFVDVDGVPNTPACMTDARVCDVASQNRIGSAKRDLLAVTDKVYAKGFDPHGAFTRPRILNAVFLKAVRFMSGMGKAPEDAPPSDAKYHEHDVGHLIIGAGASGLAAAERSRGDVLVVDELPYIGGSARWQDEPETQRLMEALRHPVWTQAIAFGYYDGVVAIQYAGDLHAVRAKKITLATGAHDAWPIFGNNDRPGVLSLRGAWRLLAQEALPGRRIVGHGAPLPEAFVQRLEAAGGAVVAQGEVVEVKGGTRVEKAKVDGQWIACDAVVCHLPMTPRIELLQQAGCELRFHDGVLAPVVDGKGRTTNQQVYWANGGTT